MSHFSQIRPNSDILYAICGPKTSGIHQALSNEYLTQQGLVSLRDGWVRFH